MMLASKKIRIYKKRIMYLDYILKLYRMTLLEITHSHQKQNT